MLKGQKMGEKLGVYKNCEVCDTPKYIYKYLIPKTKHVFCSFKCMGIAKIGKETWLSKRAKKGIRMNTGRTLFKKGMQAWNNGRHTGIAPWLGKKRSDDDKKKMSEGRKGLTTGKNHPNWQGGITESNLSERARFRKQMQKLIFKRDNYKCQICDSTKDLQVDHIQSWSEFKELRFEPDNCRTLCMACHYKITFGKEKPKDINNWGHNFGRRIAKFV